VVKKAKPYRLGEDKMNFAHIKDKMDEANRKKTTKDNLFGTDNFRSWILYYDQPGKGTDMHYHASPETFMVVEGRALVKGLNGEERILEKNEVVFLEAKDYYQITNVGTSPLVLFGNRSEAFGGPHVTFEKKD
jgi:mannose-6-phosphate isomerase-like protein (cupin superfamily)